MSEVLADRFASTTHTFVLGVIGDHAAIAAAIACFEDVAPDHARLFIHAFGSPPSDWAIDGAHRMAGTSSRVECTIWSGAAHRCLPQVDLQADAWLVHDSELHFADHSVPGATVHEAASLRTLRHVAPRTTPRRWDKVSARYPTLPSRRCSRVVVVGAGIAGAAVARELASTGVDVTVVEGDRIASGASGNPAALLEPMLGDAHNTPSKWVNQGFLAAMAASERWSLPAQTCWSTHRGPRARVQRAKIGACGHPDWVRPTPDGLALRALVVSPVDWVSRLLDHPRIDVHEGVRVTTLAGLADAHGADAVVLANSASASALVEALPLRWVRGQLGWTEEVVDIEGPLCASKYVLPPVRGRQVWGATFDPDEVSLELRASDHRAIVDTLTDAFPELPPVALTGGRVSLRGVTSGRLPFVGPAVDPAEAARTRRGDGRPAFGTSALNPDLWLTVGHGSRGFCSAFAAAWLLAEALAGAPHRITRRLAASVHPGRVLTA